LDTKITTKNESQIIVTENYTDFTETRKEGNCGHQKVKKCLFVVVVVVVLIPENRRHGTAQLLVVGWFIWPIRR
jgi:hypothetical protein